MVEDEGRRRTVVAAQPAPTACFLDERQSEPPASAGDRLGATAKTRDAWVRTSTRPSDPVPRTDGLEVDAVLWRIPGRASAPARALCREPVPREPVTHRRRALPDAESDRAHGEPLFDELSELLSLHTTSVGRSSDGTRGSTRSEAGERPPAARSSSSRSVMRASACSARPSSARASPGARSRGCWSITGDVPPERDPETSVRAVAADEAPTWGGSRPARIARGRSPGGGVGSSPPGELPSRAAPWAYPFAYCA